MQSWRWISWNLFLAALPVGAGWLLARGAGKYTLRERRVPWAAWLPLALVWFLFLPNTCYLLTEWRHFLFDPHFELLRSEARQDRDLMVTVAKYGLYFLLYSGFGVVCFAAAIRPVEHLMRAAGARPALFAPPFFFLVSLGVYMGLNIRLNSWDFVTKPDVIKDIALHALVTPRLLETVVIFAVLLWIAYEVIDIWLDGVTARLRHERS